MWFYFVILFFSFVFPFALSFDKKISFYRQWESLFLSIFIVAVLFIVVDVLYTHWGVWGFNQNYISGFHIFNLPFEEVLFFILIPYSSVFLHYVMRYYLPKAHLNKKRSNIISYVLLVVSGVLALMFYAKLYTVYSLVLVIIALLLGIYDKINEMGYFLFTFLIILVPFTIVNGLLTGSFLGKEVVWYNDAENCGIRFFTIPIEDFGYAFGMLFYVLWIKNKLGFSTSNE